MDQQKLNFSPTEIFCSICNQAICERVYIHKKSRDILGCDTCCDFDMERKGSPLIFLKNGEGLASGIEVISKNYFSILEEYIEKEAVYIENQRRNIWI